MISIIIPTYNRARLISRSVSSVLQQTFSDWELIIVDDGSNDNTAEIIRPYWEADERVKYILKPNTGAADTRNVGVQHARGEWITFLDSDDEAKTNWLESFYAEIEKGAKIISCGLEKYDVEGNLIETTLPKQNKRETGGQFTNGGVYMISRSLFHEVGGFDKDLRSGQHTELHFRIKQYALDHGIRSTLINAPLIKVHIHSGYRIRSDNRAKYEGSLYTYRKHYHTALKSKKMRSLYESIIAYNAFKIKQYNTAIKFGFKSFMNKPSKKGLQRLLRYALRLK